MLDRSWSGRQRLATVKRAFALLLCCLGLALAAPPRATAASAPPAVSFLGRDWYDLASWARANNFNFAWNHKARLVQLTNRTARLVFAVDSQQSVINGVKVWLSLPVTVQGSKVFIAVLDVRTVLEPLLKSTRPRSARKIKTIVLDPGHGGRDPGNREGAMQEKQYTLQLAQQLRAKLQAAGYKVLLTRSRDTYVDLTERAALANRARADLFVSLHFNARGTDDTAARGLEVFCLTPTSAASTHSPRTAVSSERLPGDKSGAQSLLLAYQVQKTLIRQLGMADRGVKHARFVVLREATMPAVLVEGGFMSAPDEARKIADPKFRARLAGAIADGIQLYQHWVAR